MAGKALGLAKKAAFKKSGKRWVIKLYVNMESKLKIYLRLFASVAMDKSLVGKEKTAYMKQLHKVLRNPDDFPDAIKDIQDKIRHWPNRFKSGGLAKILEV